MDMLDTMAVDMEKIADYYMKDIDFEQIRSVIRESIVKEIEKELRNPGMLSPKSELMKSIYRVINAMAIVLLAMLLLVMGTMVYKVVRWGGNPDVFTPEMNLSFPETWAKMIVTAAAFAIGVLPTGLVLVTSITLAASVIILARKQTLIQELYSLENLSRVDTICLDKTGTLTDGTMSVESVEYFALSEEDSKKLMSTLVSSMKSLNQTGQAMLSFFGSDAFYKIKEDIPFSSARKYSGAILDDGRKLLLGAPEYLSKDKTILDKAKKHAQEGKRVLLFVVDDEPIAMIVLKDGLVQSEFCSPYRSIRQSIICFTLYLANLDFREVVLHIVTEARLTVVLLLRADVSVLELFHHHDLLFLRGDEHQHACCEIAALERVLSVECQWLQVGQVRVEQYEGDGKVGQLISELTCQLELRRHHNHAVGLCLQALLRSLLK